MAKSGYVHWHEGLFLQQHHLQTMQHVALNRIAEGRQLALSYPYGVIEAELSADELENMWIRFTRLRVIMPSGVVVNVPENAELPAVNIQEIFAASGEAFTMHLAVPLWYPDRANTIERGSGEDPRTKRIYTVDEIDRPDENTGENPQPVQVRRINARLVMDHEDHSDLEVLPVLRIAHATGEEVGLPRQDPAFVPPSLVLQGSEVLYGMVRDLANQVEASRKGLFVQMSRAGFNMEGIRGTQFEQVLRLRTLGHFGGRLVTLLQAPSVAPLAVYLELRSFLGELEALHPDREPEDVPDYDHDSPYLAFDEITARIRELIQGAVTAAFLRVPFRREGKAMVADMEEEHFTQPNEYYLGIRTREDPRVLAKLVEDADKFKLMAKTLAGRAIWGIRLAEERHPPLGFPAESGLHYFRLERAESPRRWEQIVNDKGMIIRWEGLDASDFSIILFMTLP